MWLLARAGLSGNAQRCPHPALRKLQALKLHINTGRDTVSSPRVAKKDTVSSPRRDTVSSLTTLLFHGVLPSGFTLNGNGGLAGQNFDAALSELKAKIGIDGLNLEQRAAGFLGKVFIGTVFRPELLMEPFP